jgi:hypothetical protein
MKIIAIKTNQEYIFQLIIAENSKIITEIAVNIWSLVSLLIIIYNHF